MTDIRMLHMHREKATASVSLPCESELVAGLNTLIGILFRLIVLFVVGTSNQQFVIAAQVWTLSSRLQTPHRHSEAHKV